MDKICYLHICGVCDSFIYGVRDSLMWEVCDTSICFFSSRSQVERILWGFDGWGIHRQHVEFVIQSYVMSSWFSHMSWVRDSVICHTFPSGTNEVISHMNDSSHINDDYYLYKPGNMWSSWFSHMSWVRDSVICHTFLSGTNGVISHMNDSSHINDDYYRVAKTHRIPYLYRSFSAKVTYI